MQYETLGASTGSALTRYGYTGRERDDQTGLIYYRARWYRGKMRTAPLDFLV
ncbi:MAG TPA: hypothetical protein VG148_00895 [Pyrinomonadaceae bacterium]|nr:hypothetical protein [Pyrinomonadaceae bacterium]